MLPQQQAHLATGSNGSVLRVLFQLTSGGPRLTPPFDGLGVLPAGSLDSFGFKEGRQFHLPALPAFLFV